MLRTDQPDEQQDTPVTPRGKPGRPICPRCRQSFRKSGAGLAWHLANRPDCAEARNVPRTSS